MRALTMSLSLLVCCIPAAAQVQPPTFQGHDAAWWRQRLVAAAATGRVHLAAGLVDERSEVAQEVARLCEQIGAPAAPLVPELLQQLGSAGSWWTRVHCANALVAIGVASPPVCEALLAQVACSDVPRLRSECAHALVRLDPTAGARLLAAVEAGAFAQRERAVEALSWSGEAVVDDLIGALGTASTARAVARAALVRIGWRIVSRVERAGHPDLAQEALRLGPLQDIAFVDECVMDPVPPQPVVPRLPRIEWESGYGHGHGLALFRGAEDAEGFRVDVVAMTTSFPARNERKVEVRTRWLRIPRARALDAARQLTAIAGMVLRLKPDEDPFGVRHGRSTNNFHARIRAWDGETVVLDEAFAGYPTSDNVPDRFRSEAAVRVLWQALADTPWTDRAPSAADREIVQARCAEARADDWWVAERLQVIDTALRAR